MLVTSSLVFKPPSVILRSSEAEFVMKKEGDHPVDNTSDSTPKDKNGVKRRDADESKHTS